MTNQSTNAVNYFLGEGRGRFVRQVAIIFGFGGYRDRAEAAENTFCFLNISITLV